MLRPKLTAEQQEELIHVTTKAGSIQVISDKTPRKERRIKKAIAKALSRITEKMSHFAERDLVRFTLEASRNLRVDVESLTRAVEESLLHCPDIIRLGRQNGEERFTTREAFEREKRMLALVEASRADARHMVPEEAVKEAIGRRRSMTNEQAQALIKNTTQEGSMSVLSGVAGSGKGYILEAARDVWERAGFKVIGGALSGKAPDGLEKETGIKSYTIAKLCHDLSKTTLGDLFHHAKHLARAALRLRTWKRQRAKLDSRTVLVIDEAGMVDTPYMERFLREAYEARSKVVLVGDTRQLTAIGPGGVFAHIASRLGEAKLCEVMRQREEWAKEAVHDLSRGEARKVLEAYAKRGLLHVADTREAAAKELVFDWRRDRLALKDKRNRSPTC